MIQQQPREKASRGLVERKFAQGINPHNMLVRVVARLISRWTLVVVMQLLMSLVHRVADPSDFEETIRRCATSSDHHALEQEIQTSNRLNVKLLKTAFFGEFYQLRTQQCLSLNMTKKYNQQHTRQKKSSTAGSDLNAENIFSFSIKKHSTTESIPVGFDPSLYSVAPDNFIISLVDPTNVSRNLEGRAPNKGLADTKSLILGTLTKGGVTMTSDRTTAALCHKDRFPSRYRLEHTFTMSSFSYEYLYSKEPQSAGPNSSSSARSPKASSALFSISYFV
ncbi:ketol-acid reductoisomerase [Striga asiatica]|uniref:Ketol-acid reductoisomerase n=1 Tax=Striga asiatica TaxID=4170 RepID=A0A5A7QDD8_STRAF|nr:ketol-acid reductoisomerase [Striga asiatica]